ncbi:MAG: UvrD-helicase domain-containing protein [Spirochaetaceae bacterium]|nr:UvrD-helicase domain-containing protein [Spirochaetaceae bacterium]
MMLFDSVLEDLNEDQLEAVRTEYNAVVRAGAGSGKTTVLACRYAYLIMKQGLSVDEILTITFTNKATNEMYERIYTMLSANSSNSAAKKALDNFYKASIQTLDSLCVKIARSGAALFGIAPDFTSAEAGLSDMINNAALAFVLDNRENKALQKIIADKKIKSLAENLFASFILHQSSITSPVDFSRMLSLHRTFIKKDYYVLLEVIEASLNARKKKPVLPAPPAIEPLLERTDAHDAVCAAAALKAYYNALSTVHGQKTNAGMLASIANIALQFDTLAEVCTLLELFQKQCNKLKRTAGMLSFHDIAQLAVDTLLRYPEIRKVYKTQLKALMVDEFQDNNSLQRDLIFLLAEREERMDEGLPHREDILATKLFFVGDEKQSIYRFRGADVSVFRSLDKALPEHNGPRRTLQLETNYRSRSELIEAFNILFGVVFSGSSLPPAAYDAEFTPLGSCRRSHCSPRTFMHVALLEAESLQHNSVSALSRHELEALYIARKINSIVRGPTPLTVLKKDPQSGGDREVPCEFGDIALLVRKKSHQSELERALKDFNIPYNAEEPGSLFNEAFVADAVSYLRLLVYPRDALSYAALLRSPFVNVSDLALAECILQFKKLPFDEAVEPALDDEDCRRYRKGREQYYSLREQFEKGVLDLPELITTLWYEFGYRFTALAAQADGLESTESYHYLFELACRAVLEKKSLAQFLSTIEDMQKKSFEEGKRKLEQLDIPIERGDGVRILTIHKSKGLEFPVVFIYACGDEERAQRRRNSWSAFQLESSTDMLITIDLPPAPELGGAQPSPYFQIKFKEEECKKSAAELRRLLYVAATRAESELFITGTFPKLIQAERDAHINVEDPLEQRILRYCDKIAQSENASSFLNLMAGALAKKENALWELESIPVLDRTEARALTRPFRENLPECSAASSRLENARTLYAQTPLDADEKAPVHAIAASKLEQAVPAVQRTTKARRAAMSAADFGILVHTMIEERLRGIHDVPPPRGPVHKAYLLTEKFFESELGKRCRSADVCKTEYPFIMRGGETGSSAFITGKIDLLFHDAEGWTVVDYKTDKTVEPHLHTAQLKVYRDAVRNLWGSTEPVRAYIFYLRQSITFEVPE